MNRHEGRGQWREEAGEMGEAEVGRGKMKGKCGEEEQGGSEEGAPGTLPLYLWEVNNFYSASA